ncbi:MAG TPA: DUF5666 domain-containing protein, partial [Terriglobales bacterium]|nr:DUF5666 domain-containing protein [Terriglobales bacterium]
ATDPGTFNNVQIGLSTPRLTLVGPGGAIQQLTETTTPSVSLSNSSVTVPASFTLTAGQMQGLTLDFNVQSSLWLDTNGNYVITPVMKSSTATSTGLSELSMSLVKISAVQASSSSMDVQVPATGDSVHMKVDSSTTFDHAVGQFSGLQPGQMIEVEAKFQSDGSYLAKYINQGPPDPTLRFEGVLLHANQGGSSPVMQMVVR